jgi:hypothetical protein
VPLDPATPSADERDRELLEAFDRYERDLPMTAAHVAKLGMQSGDTGSRRRRDSGSRSSIAVSADSSWRSRSTDAGASAKASVEEVERRGTRRAIGRRSV